MSWSLSLEELVKAVSGKTISSPFKSFSGIASDTRKPMPDKIFFALRGENHDAHQFLAHAVQQGAKALIVDQAASLDPQLQTKASLIQVPDTLKALQDLALFWRRKHKFKVLGITGSNGKTTTKFFTQTLLAPHFSVFAAEGSFNNHWGVPFSLLGADSKTEVVIQEMGMNHSGEIRRLCEIAEPDFVCVTMVGRSHIGELGSQEAIAKAKEEIYEYSPNAISIFNRDNEWTRDMLDRAKAKGRSAAVLTFSSFEEGADVVLRATHMDLDGITLKGQIGGISGEARIPVIGRQNVSNLAAASALSLAAGVSGENIWKSLPNCRTAWGRNQIVRLQSGARAIFDGYNANPESVRALLKNLYEFEGRGKKLVILAEMLELGNESSKAHREIGLLAGQSGLDWIWFMGPHRADFEAGVRDSGFDKNLIISESYELSLAHKIRSVLKDGDIAVIKGSRGMKMERVLEALDPLDFAAKS